MREARIVGIPANQMNPKLFIRDLVRWQSLRRRYVMAALKLDFRQHKRSPDRLAMLTKCAPNVRNMTPLFRVCLRCIQRYKMRAFRFCLHEQER